MEKISLLLIALFILVGCGVKGPPLPPMKVEKELIKPEPVDKETEELDVWNTNSESAENDPQKKNYYKKKKKVNAPFQF